LIKENPQDSLALARFKRRMAKTFGIHTLTNVELLKHYHKSTGKKSLKLELLLKKRPVRSLSGIVNVSALTKPYACPGKCLYCPTQAGMPKSYLAGEPAAQRAQDLKFDPYKQTWQRLEVLEMEGHNASKIDLRIIGGTWSFYPKKYRDWFIYECFRACNDFDIKLKVKSQKSKVKVISDKVLEQEQRKNEKAKYRVIGISIETRPDYITQKEIIHLRDLGVTKVELGVQSIYDSVLDLNLRDHKTEQTIVATKLLKDAGIKVSYQIMPNLYGSSLAKDLAMFKDLFSNPDYCPDYLKIYPLAVVKEAPLYKLYKEKKFKTYSVKQMRDLLIKIKTALPYYVRVERVIRDIPSTYIQNPGAKVSNLRQLILEQMSKDGLKCNCIRCREIKGNFDAKEKLCLFRQDYDASGGKEIFLTFEDKERKHLHSLLRLRIPSQVLENKKHFLPVLQDSAIIREVHTYGAQIPVGQKAKATQHKGLGKKLIKEAEKIVKKEFKLKKIAVISGIGVREYYQKLGYKEKGTYLVRDI